VERERSTDNVEAYKNGKFNFNNKSLSKEFHVKIEFLSWMN
jgi:hypothetical protein